MSNHPEAAAALIPDGAVISVVFQRPRLPGSDAEAPANAFETGHPRASQRFIRCRRRHERYQGVDHIARGFCRTSAAPIRRAIDCGASSSGK